ncbi:MAG: hypothetical protein HQL54_05060 [Magnetococcales bacterium]|nr:hypothetical protein [Magnetococcales bacterium]
MNKHTVIYILRPGIKFRIKAWLGRIEDRFITLDDALKALPSFPPGSRLVASAG